MQKFTLPTGTTNRHQWHKPVLKAVRDLDRIRFQRRELHGVKGGDERECIISTMFAGTENETAENILINIGMAFDWSITKDNADQIVGAIRESIPQALKAMPVDDNRKTMKKKEEQQKERIDQNLQHEAAQAEKDRETQSHIEELTTLYPYAMPDNGKISGYARAAKNMKKELLRAYPYIKFSVTSDSFSMGNSICVSWDNGPSCATVDNITNKYQYYIDKCTDDNSAFSNAVGAVLGQSKYVSTQRHIDPVIKDLIAADIREACDIPDHRAGDLVWQSVSGVDITGEYAGIKLVNGEYVAFFEVTTQPEPPKPTKPTEGATVSKGTKSGYTQIEFSCKPLADIRSELKSAGFRWSPKNSVWYGKIENLPKRYEGGETQAAPVKTGERFRKLADDMQPTIDNKLGDRQTNTPKRIAQAAHARLDGEKLRRTQLALYSIATMIDAGTLPAILQGLTSKKSIFDLMGEKTEICANGLHAYHVGTGDPNQNTPQSVVLWGLLTGKTDEEKKTEELKRKIKGLQFSNIAGYFPTPDPVIDIMMNYACIYKDNKLLEPSIGSCSIADRVSSVCESIKGYDVNYSLAEIAKDKGYIVENTDFLQVLPTEEYDRVLMNPPFENLQDIEHVRHAFKFLKSGGRLISVMSPSGFNNNNKNARLFREWVDLLGGEKIDLGSGSFKSSGTNVNTILLILDKD